MYLTLNYLSLDSPYFASTVIAMVVASLSLLSLVSPLLSSLIANSSPIERLLSLKLRHISLKLRHISYTLATFYHPPSSSGILHSLQSVLESLPHSALLNLILLGDFNVDFLIPSFFVLSRPNQCYFRFTLS